MSHAFQHQRLSFLRTTEAESEILGTDSNGSQNQMSMGACGNAYVPQMTPLYLVGESHCILPPEKAPRGAAEATYFKVAVAVLTMIVLSENRVVQEATRT